MDSVLYVSTRTTRSVLDTHDIVSVARSRNAALDVTGALVATSTHYAQMLEGSSEAIAELLDSIRQDERHAEMRLVHLAHKTRRELGKWSLAYCGDSSYVSHLVASAIAAPDFAFDDQIEPIRALILMLA